MSSHYSRSFALALLLALLLILGPWMLAPRAHASDIAAQITAEIDTEIDLESLTDFFDEAAPANLAEFHVPGLALTVVHGDRVVLARGYGYADLARNVPMDPAQTLLRTGSVGKLFTWTAVMQLVEQGRLDLHTDVNAYLDFTIPPTFPEPITPAHLMAHTPGFADVVEGLFVFSPTDVPPLAEYVRSRLPERVFAPGTVQAYSNYGTALAGYIVERVSGQAYADYVEQHVFAPLGMTHSTVLQPPPPGLATETAVGYAYHAGSYLPGDFIYVGPTPAGSMSTTARDMAAFMLAYLNQGRLGDVALLQPATVDLMHSPLYSLDPRMSGMAYGWVEKHLAGYRTLSHGGSILQFHTGVYLIPELDLGFFLAYNGVNGVQARAALLAALARQLEPSRVAAADPTPPANAASHNAVYAGEYHPARAQFSGAGRILRLFDGAQVTSDADGALLVTQADVTSRYVEVEEGLYRRAGEESLMAFRQDAQGRMWLAQDGNAAIPGLTLSSAFRVPWYATLSLAALLIGANLLLFVGSALGWGVAGLTRRLRRATRPVGLVWSRWAATAFALFMVGFLAALAAALTDIDLRYGVPRVFFGDTPPVYIATAMPWGMLATLIVLIAATASAFRRGRGSWVGRFHHSLLIVMGTAQLLWFQYWGWLGG